MLMKNVFWTLGNDKTSSYDEFVEAVGEYNQSVAPDSTKWDPAQVVCKGPVSVVYVAPWKDEDDRIEMVVSTDERPITMGELLFTVHNESSDFFQDAPRRFFEGLSEMSPGTLKLHVGS
jgi:hypothetical protein